MAQFPFPIRQLPSALQDIACEMENIMDQVLNNGCSNAGSEKSTEATFAPTMDVLEDANGYQLLLDLPGVSSEGLKLEQLEDKLIVSGSREGLPRGEGFTVHRAERIQGKFSRAIRLPKMVDVERVEAELKNGVLRIQLPKIPKSTSRQIEIRTA